MRLTDELIDLLPPPPASVAITGAGGKTTMLKKLSSAIRDKGFSVLITTTTKIQAPLFYDYDAEHVFTSESAVLSHNVRKGEKVFYAEAFYDIKKTVSPALDVLSVLRKRYDYLLYEADGSRGLPVKIHTERDPVMLDDTNMVIAIMGLSAVGEKAYSAVFGSDSDETVDKAFIESYIASGEGLLKGMNSDMKNVIIINQADDNLDKIEELRDIHFPCRTIFASEEKDEVYLSL